MVNYDTNRSTRTLTDVALPMKIPEVPLCVSFDPLSETTKNEAHVNLLILLWEAVLNNDITPIKDRCPLQPTKTHLANVKLVKLKVFARKARLSSSRSEVISESSPHKSAVEHSEGLQA